MLRQNLVKCLAIMALMKMNGIQAQTIDWQGHRGCRGLLPENTVPAFLKALEFPKIKTLELDLAVSKDGKLIVSHEPWMNENICSKPDGTPVSKSEAMNLKIMDLTYEEIKAYDCGSRGNFRFPEQQPVKTYKPSLEDVVKEVGKYCFLRMKEMPAWNIEIKSHPKGDGVFTPKVEDFVKLVVAEVNRLGIDKKTCIQSFDIRALKALKEIAPEKTCAYLVENQDGYEKNLEILGFKPNIYSPDYKLLRKKDVKALQNLGIKVIPWTVNNKRQMKKLLRWGVDGIITDYPNLIPQGDDI